MPAKNWLLIALTAAILAGSGCCRFCERWCGHNYQNPVPVNYAQPAGACVPCCPQPVCCPVGSSPAAPVAPVAQPNQNWQRSYYFVDPCCGW